MDDTVTAGHLENLDRRLTRVEQILPTLATKEELRLAIAAAVTPLATKEELRLAIAPLATKEELREEFERSRRHMDVVGEALRTDIQLLAEHLHEEGERSRRHMDIVGDALRSDIQLLAEHLASVRPNPREG